MPKQKIAIFTVALVTLIACLCSALPARATSEEGFAVARSGAKEDVTRVLIMGRDAGGKLTDSILLLSVSQERKQAAAVQIPRDTYFEYTAKDYKKINGALATLGEEELLRLLSSTFCVPIRYFFILDLDGFDRMVDALGGVDLENPTEMHYTDPAQGLEIHLPQGQVHLDGKAAQHFVRYRSGYADADLGRLDAQKIFLKALGEKVQSASALQRFSLITANLSNVRTNLDLASAVRLFSSLSEFPFSEMPIVTMPGQAVLGSSGASYYVLNREGSTGVVNAYLYPNAQIDTEQFDPAGLLDREELERFHHIYIAPEEALPLSLE